MVFITGLTRGKKVWTPQFVTTIDDELCIGCGRCFKICAHGVLGPREVDEEASAKLYMQVQNGDNCIGCQACGRTCTKKAFSFAPAA